jgi:hypothetical protein
MGFEDQIYYAVLFLIGVLWVGRIILWCDGDL